MAAALTIVDYNGGNLRSVQRACSAAGIEADFTADPNVVRRSSRIIFPGVGNAKPAIETLLATGLDQALREALQRGAWVLGICLGAQLILEGSDETQAPCLGLLPGRTRRFQFADSRMKVPHIGWNEVRPKRPHFLLSGVEPGDEFYFVHSYYPDPANVDDVYASSDYGFDFCCALGRDNLFATQFHPEKSGRLGLALLERFQRWEGQSC